MAAGDDEASDDTERRVVLTGIDITFNALLWFMLKLILATTSALTFFALVVILPILLFVGLDGIRRAFPVGKRAPRSADTVRTTRTLVGWAAAAARVVFMRPLCAQSRPMSRGESGPARAYALRLAD